MSFARSHRFALCFTVACASSARAPVPSRAREPVLVRTTGAAVARARVAPEGSAPRLDPGPPVVAEPLAETTLPSACPADMVHVQVEYCPKVERVCLDKEYDKPNHITICNHYAERKPACRAERMPLSFCIDRYEYPNRAGEKPPVMRDFFEASGACAELGKRLCYESEWTAACEGPEELPFPYGYARSSEKCNFDNRWVDPALSRVYAKDPEVQHAELARLDRSLPSGARPECVSGFGVYDLTGNVDEWALADHNRPRERAKFAALKGGAWGHVRNACRPVTTSHPPKFRYYFIGFRCCSEARSGAPSAR